MSKPTLRLGFVLTRALLVLGGLLAGLGAVEIGLRVFPVPNRFVLVDQLGNLWESDPELLLHLKPNMDVQITGHPEFRFRVRTNAEGLREEPTTSRQAIVAIGDSFVFGFGVEADDAWPQRLEQISGVQVTNLGWAGWNSYVYPAALRRHAIPLHAKLWLWAFFVNDLPESTGAQDFIESGREDFKEWAADTGGSGQTLAFPLNTRTGQLVAALFNRDLFLLPDSGTGELDSGTIRFRYSPYPWQMTDPQSPDVQRGWELTESALLQARDMASQNGAELVVIYVPPREHVYWPYLEDVMQGVDGAQLDEAEQRLAHMAEAADIAYVNLLPGFREMALTGQMLYFPNDGHWNAAGHDLASRIILADLLARGAITEEP